MARGDNMQCLDATSELGNVRASLLRARGMGRDKHVIFIYLRGIMVLERDHGYFNGEKLTRKVA